MIPNKPFLWVGQKSKGAAIANPRYYELLRRFTCVTQISYPPFKGVWRLEQVVMPWLLPMFAHRFQVLFDPGARFTKWWPGHTIIDIDDPIFTSEEIQRLKDSRISVIVTTTPELAHRISTETGKKVHVIPSGFSARDINLSIVHEIRDHLKAVGNLVIGYTSPYLLITEEPHQNDVSLLLDAMHLVWKKEPTAELWLVGIPDRKLKSIAAQHKNIRLLGPIQRNLLLNYVCNFDVGVYPRRLDHGGRFSVKLIEYIGCGVPIVATKVSETNIVNKANAGFVVETKEEFAEAIITLLRDPSLRKRCSENAQQFAKEYDWDYLAQRYEREVFWRLLIG